MTNEQIQDLLEANLPSGTPGAITAAKLREVLENILAVLPNTEDGTGLHLNEILANGNETGEENIVITDGYGIISANGLPEIRLNNGNLEMIASSIRLLPSDTVGLIASPDGIKSVIYASDEETCKIEQQGDNITSTIESATTSSIIKQEIDRISLTAGNTAVTAESFVVTANGYLALDVLNFGRMGTSTNNISFSDGGGVGYYGKHNFYSETKFMTEVAMNSTLSVNSSTTLNSLVVTGYFNLFRVGKTDFVSDGIQTVFEIPHDFLILPSSISLTFSNELFHNAKITVDETNITISFELAPPAGEITAFWQVFK